LNCAATLPASLEIAMPMLTFCGRFFVVDMDGNPLPPPESPLDSLSEGNTADSSATRATAQSSQELNRSISSLLASADEIQNRQLRQQQWMLQQQLSQQSREELLYQNQIRALLEANTRSQQRPPITSLQNLYGEQFARAGVPPLGMDHGLGGLVPLNNDAASISALLQNIQRRNFEQEQLLRRQQHRELMSGVSLDLYPNISSHRNISQLASDISAGTSSTSIPNYAATQQQSLYPFTARSDFLGSSNQSMSEVSSSLNANLQQQLLLQEYLRSQQQQQGENPADRLTLLLQQRQELQSTFPLASQNIPVADQSMHASSVAKASSGKILKSPLESGFVEGGFAPKPKRPLSAYNIFFQEERQKLLKDPDEEGNPDTTADDSKPAAIHAPTEPPPNKGGSKKRKRGKPHHKVSFEEMAKIIGQRWKELQESDQERKLYYQNLAQTDKERYRAELLIWKKQRSVMISQQRKSMEEEEEDTGEDY
jgi:HMG-box domain